MLTVFCLLTAARSFSADSAVHVIGVSPDDGGYTLISRPVLHFNFDAANPGVNLDSLEVFVDGALVPWSVDQNGNYSGALAADLSGDPYWATVVFVDTDGNIGGRKWTFLSDYSNPQITILSPQNGAAVVATSLPVYGFFTGVINPSTQCVSVKLNNGTPKTTQLSGFDPVTGVTYFWCEPQTVAPGWANFTATVTSPGGKTSGAVSSALIYAPPTVTLPGQHGITNSNQIGGDFNGGGPGGLNLVHVVISGPDGSSNIGTPFGNSYWTWVWLDGPYTLEFCYVASGTSHDYLGSYSVPLLVDTAPPQFTVVDSTAFSSTLNVFDPLSPWGQLGSGVNYDSIVISGDEGCTSSVNQEARSR